MIDLEIDFCIGAGSAHTPAHPGAGRIDPTTLFAFVDVERISIHITAEAGNANALDWLRLVNSRQYLAALVTVQSRA